MNRHERTERMFMPHQACTVPGERMTAAERARRRARAKDARAARRRNR